MRKIEEILIVEGTHDISKLKSVIDAEIIQTSGSSLPQQTIEYINTLVAQGKKFIIFTDPDAPGNKIRTKLNEIIPNAQNAFISKEKAKTSKKVGVEHAKADDILNSLDNMITFSKVENKISSNDLYELGLVGSNDSAQKRKKISDNFSIGECNAKQFLKRINLINLDRDQLVKKIREIISV